MSKKVLIFSLGLAVVRLAAFFLIFFNQGRDAQWQLSYVPLWIADLPISILYFMLPIPWAEAIIGPIWWFGLSVIISRLLPCRHPQR